MNMVYKNGIKKLLLFFGLLAVAIVVIFAPLLITHDPYVSDAMHILSPPGPEHILGCDHLGRDLYSRVLLGARSSLFMAVIGVGINFFVGTTLGVLAGYVGKRTEVVIMRLADIMLAFPGIVLSIAIVGVMGSGAKNTLLALTISGWAEFSRMSRALVIGEKQRDYLRTAILSGNSSFGVVFRYILPNILPQMMVFCTLHIGSFILRFSALAFLGLGFQPPKPELGLILSEAKNFMQLAPFYMIYPGLVLFLIVLIFNALGDSLRDHLDGYKTVRKERGRLN